MRAGRYLRWALWTVGVVALAVIGLAGGVLWFIGSDAGLRMAIEQVALRTGDRLKLEGVTGSLMGSVHVDRLSYIDTDLGLTADNVDFTWSPRALLSRNVVVDAFAASHISLALKSSDKPASPPASLAIPLPIEVQKASVARIDIASGVNTWTISGLAFRYAGNSSQHRFDDLALDTPWGALRGILQVDAAKPFATKGTIALAGSEILRKATASIDVGGNFELLSLGFDGAVIDAKAKGLMHVAPFDPRWLHDSTLAIDSLDLARIDPRLPRTALTGNVGAAGEDDGSIRGSLTVRNGEAGSWSDQKLPIQTLSTGFIVAGQALSLDALNGEVTGAGRVTGSASFNASAVQWNLALRDIDLHALARNLNATRLVGKLEGRARLDTADIEGTLAGELRQSGIALAFDATLLHDVVNVRSFKAEARGGAVRGSATVALRGAEQFSVAATAFHLDPSAFGNYPSASLSGTVDARGALKPNWSAALGFKIAPGSRLRGLALTGEGNVSVSPGHVAGANIDIAVSSNHLVVIGDFGNSGDQLAFSVDAGNLAAVDTEASGTLHASGRISGTWAQPTIAFSANGSSLHFGTAYSIGSIAVEGELGANGAAMMQRPLTLNASVSSLHVDALAVRTVTLRMAGSLAQHQATIEAVGGSGDTDLDVTAKVDGGWTGDASTGSWSGKIVSLDGRGPYKIALDAPAQFDAGVKSVHLASMSGTLAGGHFAIDDLRWQADRLSSDGAFSAMPTAFWLALTSAGTRVASTLTLSGRWSFVASPKVNGTLSINRDAGDVSAVNAPDLALGLSLLEAHADIVDDRIHATLTARSAFADADVTADLGASTSATGHFGQGAPLKLTGHVDARSLKALQALAGTTAIVDGRLTLDLAGEGTLDRVRFTGSVDGNGLKIEAPQYGVYLKDGTLSAHLADNAVTVSELSFTGGKGRFTASGTLPAAMDGEISGSRLSWKADNLALFDRPDTKLVLSGEGTLAMQRKAVELVGALRADQGYFEFRPTPPDALGSDVVIRGRERRSTDPAQQRVPFDVDLELDFGDHFTFVGEGFNSGLVGKVRVKTTANRELAGFGSISTVNGTYTAFGQRLAIDHGQLYFNGPLDNPGLDVVALRKNMAVEAGVAVTGTVRVPIVQLTSSPPVPDNEKLSWLILGHGLDSTNAADSAALQAAVAAIGGAGAAPIGQRIAKTFGVDDISLHSADPTKSGAPGGQVVALSKRLTEKLSLVYEQGLTLANNALKIEYNLSRNVTIRAEAGVVSGFGIYYSRSFD
jgi:translocation and assembly module TamB